METNMYICIGLGILLTVIVIIVLHHREGFKERRYKLIIPPNGILVSKTQSQYGSEMPNYTVDQATEIYKRGLEVVNTYSKSQYKTWENSQLGVDFHNLVTAIMFAPEKANKLTEGLDVFNNNRVIVAANIISLETMQQPATWVGNREYMNALHAYQDSNNTFI
jgi:hypothetical protein